MTKAFITGSRAYGTPREDSDIDLAILIDADEGDILWKAGAVEGEKTCRFGCLNLIIFNSESRFERWAQVTNDLRARRPVSRDEAIAAFQAAEFTQYGTKEETAAEIAEMDAVMELSLGIDS